MQNWPMPEIKTGQIAGVFVAEPWYTVNTKKRGRWREGAPVWEGVLQYRRFHTAHHVNCFVHKILRRQEHGTEDGI